MLSKNVISISEEQLRSILEENLGKTIFQCPFEIYPITGKNIFMSIDSKADNPVLDHLELEITIDSKFDDHSTMRGKKGSYKFYEKTENLIDSDLAILFSRLVYAINDNNKVLANDLGSRALCLRDARTGKYEYIKERGDSFIKYIMDNYSDMIPLIYFGKFEGDIFDYAGYIQMNHDPTKFYFGSYEAEKFEELYKALIISANFEIEKHADLLFVDDFELPIFNEPKMSRFMAYVDTIHGSQVSFSYYNQNEKSEYEAKINFRGQSFGFCLKKEK